MKLFDDPNLLALEVRHGQSSTGPLFQLSENQLPSALSEFLLSLYAGEAQTLYPDDSERLIAAKGFKQVYLAGGKSLPIFNYIRQLKIPFAIEHVENFSCLKNSNLTIDWGQSSIKIYQGSAKRVIPRDLKLFPLRCSVKDANAYDLDAKNKIRRLFRNILKEAHATSKVSLALPVKIRPDLWAEPSTYHGLEGDLIDLFQTELKDIEFMNDAVLAARQVQELKNTRPHNTLVLTTGYGVGAAFWRAV